MLFNQTKWSFNETPKIVIRIVKHKEQTRLLDSSWQFPLILHFIGQ